MTSVCCAAGCTEEGLISDMLPRLPCGFAVEEPPAEGRSGCAVGSVGEVEKEMEPEGLDCGRDIVVIASATVMFTDECYA